MHYETSTTTAAEPSRLWAVVSDFERWPQWIDVCQQVRRTSPGPLTVGTTARVKQKGLAAGDWTVTELDEGTAFGWESRQPGVQLVARHVVTAEPVGGSRLTLQLEMTGRLSGFLRALVGRKARSYVDLECARLAAVAAEHTAA